MLSFGPLLNASRRLPGRCQVCGRWPAQPVCTACLQRYAAPRLRCQCCATPVDHGGPLCGACLIRPTTAPVKRCAVALDYGYPWAGLIARWKFGGEAGWSGQWADLMLGSASVQSLLQDCGLLVPIPLSATRLAERGFNQSWELACALLRRTHPVRPKAMADALVRVRDTPDQHSLPRAQRLQNLRGAFMVHPQRRHALANAGVLLVDDVSTTGATLEAAAQALLESGATRVSAVALARTPPAERVV